MSQQRVAEARTLWDFAFTEPVSDHTLVRLCGWIQAFGTGVVERALERAAMAGEDMPEDEAAETVRVILKEWKRRGWL